MSPPSAGGIAVGCRISASRERAARTQVHIRAWNRSSHSLMEALCRAPPDLPAAETRACLAAAAAPVALEAEVDVPPRLATTKVDPPRAVLAVVLPIPPGPAA